MKRRLTKLVVFLLLGAILNVAVAWGSLLVFPPQSYYRNEVGMSSDATAKIVSAHFPSFRLVASECCYGTRTWRFGWVEIFGGGGVDHDDGDTLPDYVRVDTYEAGWPSYGMAGRTLWEDGQGRYEFALLLPSWIRDRTGRLLEFLPLGPIWPGFAINTIFYAAIVWMLWSSPFAARRMIRHKRGRCIKCGYDLRGDFSAGCPECGWRREDVP